MGFLSFIPGLDIASDIYGGIQKKRALSRAETLQLNAINQARGNVQTGLGQTTETLRGGQQQSYEAGLGALGGVEETNAPYEQTGRNALYALGNENFASGNIPFQAPQFQFDPSQVQQDPGFQFRMDQAMQALSRSAAGRGALGSGGTLKALTEYGQGLASQEYGNAYGRAFNTALTRFQTGLQGGLAEFNAAQENQANRFNRLYALGGLGRQAAAQTAGAQQQFGRDVMSLDETTAARIGGYQQGAAGDLANLSLQEGAVRAGTTLGQTENVLGALRNTSYDLGQLAQRVPPRRRNMTSAEAYRNFPEGGL